MNGKILRNQFVRLQTWNDTEDNKILWLLLVLRSYSKLSRMNKDGKIMYWNIRGCFRDFGVVIWKHRIFTLQYTIHGYKVKQKVSMKTLINNVECLCSGENLINHRYFVFLLEPIRTSKIVVLFNIRTMNSFQRTNV